MNHHLEYAIKNSQASIEKEDLEVLLPLVERVRPRNILEIGTWKGYSADTWLSAFFPDKLITIEIEPKIEGAVMFGGATYLWETDSHSEITRLSVSELTPEVDFLFIDGDHSTDGVIKDWQNYSPLVRDGGIIALHDVLHYNKDPEVNVGPLWEELKTKHKYLEIKVGPNSTGLGVIFK